MYLLQVFGEVKWSDVKYSAAVTSPFAVSKFGGSVELPTAGKPSIRGYWNNDEASLTVSYPGMGYLRLICSVSCKIIFLDVS